MNVLEWQWLKLCQVWEQACSEPMRHEAGDELVLCLGAAAVSDVPLKEACKPCWTPPPHTHTAVSERDASSEIMQECAMTQRQVQNLRALDTKGKTSRMRNLTERHSPFHSHQRTRNTTPLNDWLYSNIKGFFFLKTQNVFIYSLW